MSCVHDLLFGYMICHSSANLYVNLTKTLLANWDLFRTFATEYIDKQAKENITYFYLLTKLFLL